MTLGTVKAPTPAQLRALSEDLGFDLSETDLATFGELMRPSIDAYNAVDRMAQELPPVKYPRMPGHRPSGEENRYGAWYVKTKIEGARGGKLAGKRLAIKDNVCIAGVPMMNGASTLEGYVPDVDATIVTRILDAGGTILGKAVCEYFSSPAAAIPARPGRCTTRTAMAIRPAARPPAAPRWLRPARSTWRSAATRAARSASRRRSAASTA